MPRTFWVCLAGTLLAMLLGGCSAKGTERPKLVVVLVDTTSSFASLRESCELIAPLSGSAPEYRKGIVGSLRDSDVLVAIRITREATKHDVIIEPTTITDDPIRPAQGRRQRRELMERFKALAYSELKGTDLIGAVYQASVILQSRRYSGYEKYLLMFSDMQDTQARRLTPNLKGVHCRVFFFPMPLANKQGDPMKTAEDSVTQQLLNWHAETTRIYNEFVSFAANPYAKGE